MQQAQPSDAKAAPRSEASNVPVRKECNIPGKQAYMLWHTLFEIDEVYQPIKAIGKGAYGVVCSAKNMATGEKVAIKKITSAFDNLTDAKRTLREIKLLRHLRQENIIAILDIMQPTSKDKFNDVYLVNELMDTDLHQIIRSSQPLSDDHYQYFVYQILRGLKFIHTANVLHRDLKPSNLLLNASCDLKICDFGLARTSSERNFMTEYVVTRWYRAPELLLSCEHYTAAIDIWSVGCILAELLQRKPLFAGKDYIDQLKLIIKTLGSPSDSDLSFINSQKAQQYIKALPKAQRANFRALFPDASPKSIDLMERMLHFDPRKRITVEEALRHPYLAQLHDPASEPSAPSHNDLSNGIYKLSKPCFDYSDNEAFVYDVEEDKLNEAGVRAAVWDEMTIYHPEALNMKRL